MKTCKRCLETKPVDDFYKSAQMKDGLRSECKPCFNAMKARSIKKIRDLPKPTDNSLLKTCTQCGEGKPRSEYFHHNGTRDGLRPDCKECLTSKQKDRYERDKTKILASQRDYAQRNADTVKRWHQQAHRRRSQNPEWKARTQSKAQEWQRANPENRALNQQRRRARLATAPVNDFTRKQWQALKAAFGHRCAYCGIESKRLTMDHVIPLARGGPHTARNIVPACTPCNARKGERPPLPFHVIPASFVS